MSAILYTAASMLFGGSDGAILAARGAVDAAMEVAEGKTGELLELDVLNTISEVQTELELQNEALRLIAGASAELRQGRASDALLRALGRR